jgi:hypothetical protein
MRRPWPQSERGGGSNTDQQKGDLMAADFVHTSAFLHQEVHAFFRALRHGKGDEERIRAAAERLSAAVAFAEPFGEDPGDAWDRLSREQQWGYLQVVSLLGTAVHALRRLGI